MPNGKSDIPCRAFRERMVRLMPERYKNVGIMLDFEQEKVITFGNMKPEWWIWHNNTFPEQIDKEHCISK